MKPPLDQVVDWTAMLALVLMLVMVQEMPVTPAVPWQSACVYEGQG